MRLLTILAASAVLTVVLVLTGTGAGEFPIGVLVQGLGRPVTAHVAKPPKGGAPAKVEVQYEAAEGYWPSVEIPSFAAAEGRVKDGDKLPAHAIGGRMGTVRLDADYGRGKSAFMTGMFACIILVGWLGGPLLGWSRPLVLSAPRVGRRPPLNLPSFVGRASDTVGETLLIMGLVGFGGGSLRWALAVLGALLWGGVRLGTRKGWLGFYELSPPGEEPAALVISTGDGEPVRPERSPASVPPMLLARRAGWSTAPAALFLAGVVSMVLGQFWHGNALDTALGIATLGGVRLCGWDIGALVLLGAAAGWGLRELRRSVKVSAPD